MKVLACLGFIIISFSIGCSGAKNEMSSGEKTPASSKKPLGQFSLAWSEYPSWSVFGVAGEIGLIDKEAGKLGEMEKKWNVDIVLKQAEYDPCIALYGSGTVDAVCITNMDMLGPADKRASVAILPTSTSDGADACIAVGVNSLDSLKGVTTYGLEKSVSQYCFERVIEEKKLSQSDYPFAQMDPGAAATAMQTGDSKVKSIIVWNPFVMQTLKTRADAKVMFDSSSIKEEIVDMVVVAKDSLKKPGGKAFALAVLDTYYEMNRRIADVKTQDETLIAIGAQFSKLGLEEMKKVVQQTRFYSKPEEAIALLDGEQFQKKTMPSVAAFCASHGIIEKAPAIGFNDEKAQINIDASYLKLIQEGVTPDKL